MAIKIIKNRSDIGAGTRGADMGIDAIEVAAINKGSDFFNGFPFVDIDTHNESIYDKVKNSFAKRIGHVLEQCTRLAETVEATLKTEDFPLILSGDHSSALGTMSGIKAAFPEKRIGVVWIDAHADLHSPHTTPSGNIHGMPLAAALNFDNLEDKVNELESYTDNAWTKLKNIGIEGPKLIADDLVFFGVRDTETPEDNLMARHGIRNFKVAEVRHRGLDVCVNEALERLSACDMLYISFDVDSLDCDMISYGTGTPVPKGFDQYEAIAIINGLLKSGKCAAFECVEVNPLLDMKGNKMAETAFEVLEATVVNMV